MRIVVVCIFNSCKCGCHVVSELMWEVRHRGHSPPRPDLRDGSLMKRLGEQYRMESGSLSAPRLGGSLSAPRLGGSLAAPRLGGHRVLSIRHAGRQEGLRWSDPVKVWLRSGFGFIVMCLNDVSASRVSLVPLSWRRVSRGISRPIVITRVRTILCTYSLVRLFCTVGMLRPF